MKVTGSDSAFPFGKRDHTRWMKAICNVYSCHAEVWFKVEDLENQIPIEPRK